MSFTAVCDDLVSVLHHLQFFVAVVSMQPHAFADHFKDVYDPEGPVSLMRAQFAVIGVINRYKRIHPCIARRFKFHAMQFAPELWQGTDIHTLQSHRWLMEIHQFDTGDHLQDFSGGFHHSVNAWVPVQRNSHVNPVPHLRLELRQPVTEKAHERMHLEWPRTTLSLGRRQNRFRVLDVAHWAPGDHLPEFE